MNNFDSYQGPERVLCSADTEANGLEDASKFWCLSVTELSNHTRESRSFNVTNPQEMKDLFLDPQRIWIFHNGHDFDKRAIERIFKIKMAGKVVDTLALSWYLYPKRVSHGLAAWGEDLGIKKPEVDDELWKGPTEGMTDIEHLKIICKRCDEDVRIQTAMWKKMWKDLMSLYDKDEDKVWHCIDYLSFKMECVGLQKKNRWKLDVSTCKSLNEDLYDRYQRSKTEFEGCLPKVPVKEKKSRPKKPYKKNGDLSVNGCKWKDLTDKHGKPFDYEGEVEVITGYKEPNGGSPTQIKNWLFSMGWVPTFYDYKRDKETGEVRKIPQIKDKNSKELCPDIVRLSEDFPVLKLLVDMSVLKHRYDVTKGFLDAVDDEGFIQAQAQGFTNTLRLVHKVFLNVPGVDKPYGKEIRGLLVARSEDHEVCGADMVSLEDTTKQHYIWPYDPDYVREMMDPSFEPHCDIAVQAGLMTKEEYIAYVNKDPAYDLEAISKEKRKPGKATNYAAVYGAGGDAIARSAGIPKREGHRLKDIYWKRNWSVKEVAKNCQVKQFKGLKRLYNPVSNIWVWLKVEKDRFSTLNQSTGAYCFDLWLKEVLSRRRQLNGQAHDEGVWELLKSNRTAMEKILRDSIMEVNRTLKLNRELDIDVQFGDNYAEVH